jgi:hypothetical protein
MKASMLNGDEHKLISAKGRLAELMRRIADTELDIENNSALEQGLDSQFPPSPLFVRAAIEWRSEFHRLHGSSSRLLTASPATLPFGGDRMTTDPPRGSRG